MRFFGSSDPNVVAAEAARYGCFASTPAESLRSAAEHQIEAIAKRRPHQQRYPGQNRPVNEMTGHASMIGGTGRIGNRPSVLADQAAMVTSNNCHSPGTPRGARARSGG